MAQLPHLVQAKWTDRILDEMLDALRKNLPDISDEKVGRLRDLMNAAVRDCLVSDWHPRPRARDKNALNTPPANSGLTSKTWHQRSPRRALGRGPSPGRAGAASRRPRRRTAPPPTARPPTAATGRPGPGW